MLSRFTFLSFFNFLSSQKKSDDILPEVKLDDVNNRNEESQ